MNDALTEDKLAESLLHEILKSTPTARLGFPTIEELQRMNDRRQTGLANRDERRREDRDRRFQLLKTAALANLRKDRP